MLQSALGNDFAPFGIEFQGEGRLTRRDGESEGRIARRKSEASAVEAEIVEMGAVEVRLTAGALQRLGAARPLAAPGLIDGRVLQEAVLIERERNRGGRGRRGRGSR